MFSHGGGGGSHGGGHGGSHGHWGSGYGYGSGYGSDGYFVPYITAPYNTTIVNTNCVPENKMCRVKLDECCPNLNCVSSDDSETGLCQ